MLAKKIDLSVLSFALVYTCMVWHYIVQWQIQGVRLIRMNPGPSDHIQVWDMSRSNCTGVHWTWQSSVRNIIDHQCDGRIYHTSFTNIIVVTFLVLPFTERSYASYVCLAARLSHSWSESKRLTISCNFCHLTRWHNHSYLSRTKQRNETLMAFNGHWNFVAPLKIV